MSPDTIVAIDPGSSSGAIAVFAGNSLSVHNMPDTMAGIYKFFAQLFHTGAAVRVIMEDVGATRPGNRAKSARTFAVHQGHLEMACYACGLPVTKVLPQKWMKDLFGSTLPHGEENMAARKTKIYDAVQRWYPGVQVTKRQADALAILHWALREKK